MTTTLTSADVAAFKQLAQFENRVAMDATIAAFLRRNKYELAPAARKVLKAISGYAVKFAGVAYTKIETLAREAAVSRSSVERAIRALKRLGIIEVHHTARRRGGQGHSVYVVQAANDAPTDVPQMTYREEPQKVGRTSTETARQPAETNIFKANKTNLHKRNTYVADARKPSTIPHVLAAAVRPFSRSLCTPAHAWGRVVLAHREARLTAHVGAEEVVRAAVGAFKEAVASYKAGRVRKDFAGYYYGVLRQVFAVERRREVAAQGQAGTGATYAGGFDWVAAAGACEAR